MNLFLDLLTFLIGAICALISLRRILKSNYSILHVCTMLFFVIQVIPLVVDIYSDVSLLQQKAKYEYTAMTDPKTALFYDLFCCLSLVILLFAANNYSRKAKRMSFAVSFSKGKFLSVILFFLMFVTIGGVLLSPDPSVYTVFSYFYTQSGATYNISYLYHNSVMKYVTYIAFLAIVCFYYLNSGKTICTILTFVASSLVIWFDGKRSIMAFLIVGILFVDFMKQNISKKKLVKKALLFVFLFVAYFVLYSQLTDKQSDDPFYITYNAYFSREAEVKLSIYSRLLGPNSMLPYDGATLLYDIVAFVPRFMWPDKPYGFYNYLTAFAYNGNGDDFLSNCNFQVNIWSEFIANYGIFGFALSIFVVLEIVKISERSKHKEVNLLGGLFVLTYFFLGFEMIVMLLFYLWSFFLFRSFFQHTLN